MRTWLVYVLLVHPLIADSSHETVACEGHQGSCMRAHEVMGDKEDITALLQVSTRLNARARPSKQPILDAAESLEQELAAGIAVTGAVGEVQGVTDTAPVSVGEVQGLTGSTAGSEESIGQVRHAGQTANSLASAAARVGVVGELLEGTTGSVISYTDTAASGIYLADARLHALKNRMTGSVSSHRAWKEDTYVWVWTAVGISKMTTDGVMGLLNNPMAGDEVTEAQKTLIEPEGGIAAASADGLVKKKLVTTTAAPTTTTASTAAPAVTTTLTAATPISFRMTADGSNCPAGTDITTETQCQAAGKALGAVFGSAWNGPGEHKDCSIAHDGRNQVFFNTAGELGSETAASTSGSICSQVAITTCGGTGNRAPCIFPFSYKAQSYSSCTDVDSAGLWCATSYQFGSSEYKEWGRCDCQAPLTVAELPKQNEFRNFLAACVICFGIIGISLLCFSCFRQRFKEIYNKPLPPTDPPIDATANSGKLFGWVGDSVKLNTKQMEAAAGLDAAMFRQFFVMSLRIFIFIGIPTLGVMACLNSWKGGGKAGDNHFDKITMRNIVQDSWLFWVHAFLVWYVLGVAQWIMFDEQTKFAERRRAWLRAMPPPQSTTILVENIPENLRSDQSLTNQFNSLGTHVESVHVVKYMGFLNSQCANIKRMQEQLENDENQFRYTGSRPMITTADGVTVDAITYRRSELEKLEYTAQEERAAIKNLAGSNNVAESCQVCSASAFVTLKSRHAVNHALDPTIHQEKWTLSTPPDPSDVIYNDLLVTPDRKKYLSMTGYLCLAALFLTYVPVTYYLCKICSSENLQEVWPYAKKMQAGTTYNGFSLFSTIYDGVMHAWYLTVVMSIWPRMLALIFNTFWVMKSGGATQCAIQNWYLAAEVIFVLILTSIGTGLHELDREVLHSPWKLFKTVELDMDYASNFYLKYFIVEICRATVFDFCRLVVLANFLAYVHLRKKSTQSAAELCEPEDQSYYGVGARSARVTLIFIIGICFCQISPVIVLMAIIFFGLCYLTYPYLITFAEKRKLDSGGKHWLNMMEHIQLGLFMYVALMTAFLGYEAGNHGPAWVSASSIILLLIANYRFRDLLRSGEQVDDTAATPAMFRNASRDTYQQPELKDAKEDGRATAGCFSSNLNYFNCSGASPPASLRPVQSVNYNRVPGESENWSLK